MSFQEIVTILIPFVLSATILLTNLGLRSFTTRSAHVVFPELFQQSEGIRKACIDLVVYVNIQTSFLFSILTMSISSVALIGTTTNLVPIIIAIAIPILIIPYWFMNWTGLTADQLEGTEGRWMQLCSWAVIVILFLVTLITKLSPQPPSVT